LPVSSNNALENAQPQKRGNTCGGARVRVVPLFLVAAHG
jgi:hypothetical protein